MTPMHSAGQARAACPCAGLAFPCGGRAMPMRLAGQARPAPVRGSGASVQRPCDAGAFGRRVSSRRCITPVLRRLVRAWVAHFPRVSRTSGTVTRCHGRRLLAKGVVLRAAMSEGGAKKKAGTICAETAATNGPRWWSPALCLLSRAYRPGFRPPPC